MSGLKGNFIITGAAMGFGKASKKYYFECVSKKDLPRIKNLTLIWNKRKTCSLTCAVAGVQPARAGGWGQGGAG